MGKQAFWIHFPIIKLDEQAFRLLFEKKNQTVKTKVKSNTQRGPNFVKSWCSLGMGPAK